MYYYTHPLISPQTRTVPRKIKQSQHLQHFLQKASDSREQKLSCAAPTRIYVRLTHNARDTSLSSSSQDPQITKLPKHKSTTPSPSPPAVCSALPELAHNNRDDEQHQYRNDRHGDDLIRRHPIPKISSVHKPSPFPLSSSSPPKKSQNKEKESHTSSPSPSTSSHSYPHTPHSPSTYRPYV